MPTMTNASNQWGQPRSTPIPGGEPIAAPPDLGTPMTPSQFIGGAHAPQAPTGTPPPMTGMPYGTAPGMGGMGGIPGMGGMPGMGGTGFPTTRRRRNIGGTIFVWLIILVTLGGVGVGVWAAVKGVQTANDATERSNQLSDPHLSDEDRTALGLTGGEQNLWEGEGLARMAAVFDASIAGEPTNFTQISFYSDYAFAIAQHPTVPNQLDQYGWRLGVLDPPTPQSNDDDAPNIVFTVDQVNWSAVAGVAAQANSLLGISDGEISHVMVDKGIFSDGNVTVRIYVTSPRASGYIEVSADGTVLATY